MLLLDCYDVSRTYRSLSSILGLTKGEIDDFLLSCDPADDLAPAPDRPESNVFNRLRKQAEVGVEYDGTCWHHFTRAPYGVDFRDGLRPLGSLLPALLSYVGELAEPAISAEAWAGFEADVLAGHISLPRLERRDSGDYQQGPFGGLVRDFAFHKTASRDYLRQPPEAVEDVIRAARERFEIDLLSRYLDATTPCIVGFQNARCCVDDLHSALYYLLETCRGEGLSANAYSSRHGITVPFEDITRVEWLLKLPPPIPASGD